MANRVGAAPSVNGRPIICNPEARGLADGILRGEIDREWRTLKEQYVAGRITEDAYEAESLKLARREAVLVGMS